MNKQEAVNALIEKLPSELRDGLKELTLDGKLSAIGFFALIDGNVELAQLAAEQLKCA